MAEQRLSRGVEQLAQDRQQLPSALRRDGAAAGRNDEMQQDASSHAGERRS